MWVVMWSRVASYVKFQVKANDVIPKINSIILFTEFQLCQIKLCAYELSSKGILTKGKRIAHLKLHKSQKQMYISDAARANITSGIIT